MAPTSGILYVTMQPSPTLPPAQFHDWYDNEHGPLRLRLPFITNGFRYHATDHSTSSPASDTKPEWMAIYDVTDMELMTKDVYTSLRKEGKQTQRERDTMKGIKVHRRFFDLVSERKAESWRMLEDVNSEDKGATAKGNILIAAELTLKPGEDNEKELDKFYEEHIHEISLVHGWLRTRRFVTSSIEQLGTPEYLSLHEFGPENGLSVAQIAKAVSTPWMKERNGNIILQSQLRIWGLHYTFGPAPRDLAPIVRESNGVKDWVYSNGMTKTIPGKAGQDWGAIESYVTTSDGVKLPYRLEGSPDEDAPLIVLCNSILVDWGIWDGFVKSFLSKPENKDFRILRYLARGRTADCGGKSVTVDVLALDIIALLDAIRVPTAAAVIGVSLGGATALNFALKYPQRASAFVSCDTSSKSPAGNSKAWGDRIAVAEKEDLSTEGQKVVGNQLAEVTVRRWFVKGSYDGGYLEKEIERVKGMVARNSLDGFKKAVEALFEYDLKEEMKASKVRGMFLVGSGDGVLPKTMKEMSEEFGNSAEYQIIDEAGHLPMVEKPKEVADVVTKFLHTR